MFIQLTPIEADSALCVSIARPASNSDDVNRWGIRVRSSYLQPLKHLNLQRYRPVRTVALVMTAMTTAFAIMGLLAN